MDAVEQALDVARKDAHMSWADVARHIDVVPVTLWRYRKNILRSDDTTYRLEKLFDMSSGHLDALTEPTDPAARRIPTLDELEHMRLVDVLGVLDQVEKINGKAARDGLRDTLAAYLDRRARTVEPNGAPEQAPAAT